MTRRFAATALLAALLFTPLPAALADATPLAIPKDAILVAQLNGRGPVAGHVEQFLTRLDAEAGKRFPKQLQSYLKEQATGRDLGAIPADARLVAVAFTLDGWNTAAPPWVWLVPAADYREFRRKLLTEDERRDFEAGRGGIDRVGEMFLVNLPASRQVAVTASEAAAQKIAAQSGSVPAERLGVLAPLLNESDLALYVNVAALQAQYGDSVRGYLQLAKVLLQAGGSGVMPAFDARQLETVRIVLDGFTQAFHDGRDLALGISLGADGVTVRGEFAATPNTATSKLFAGNKPTALEALLNLPAGRTTYSASAWSATMTTTLRTLSREYQAPKDDERAVEAVKVYEALVAKVGQSVGASAGESGGSLWTTPDPAALTAAHAKVIRTMTAAGWYRNIPIREKPSVSGAVVEASGFTLHRATIALDLEAAVSTVRDPNLKQATLESIKRLVSEKTVVWFGHDGRRYTQLEAPTPEAAKKLLGDLLAEPGRVSGDAAFLETRKRLPAEATLLMLAEAGPTVRMLADYTQSVSGALPAVPGFEVPEFRVVPKPPHCFVGLAVTLQPGRAGFTVVVPAAAAKIAKDSTVIPDP